MRSDAQENNALPANLAALKKKLAEVQEQLDDVRQQCEAAKALLTCEGPTESRVWTPGKQWENVWQPLFALAMLVTGLISLICYLHGLALVTVVLTDAFLLVSLIALACRKGLRSWFLFDFAHRFFYIFIFWFLLGALICSFGTLYIHSHDVCRGGDRLDHPIEAAYFSTVTILTVGYGDFAPRSTSGQILVICELASGGLLLLLIVPVLASRLALLGEGH